MAMTYCPAPGLSPRATNLPSDFLGISLPDHADFALNFNAFSRRSVAASMEASAACARVPPTTVPAPFPNPRAG